MKSTKIVTWTAKDGRQAEVTIIATREMRTETAYADGWNIDLGKKPYEELRITLAVDGKRIEYAHQAPVVISEENYYKKDYVAKVKAAGGYARLGDNVIIKEDIYNEIIKAIEEATTEANHDEEYAAHIEAKKVAEEAARPAKEAKEKELKETEIPAEAIKAYNHYHGSADKAWEDENETAWALIRKWTPYIEAQHGTDPEKLKRIASEVAKETNYGIND
jgi:hypothetical protein